MDFDFRPLVNALLANGQWHLPPMDTVRMGQVVGYDPGYTQGTAATEGAYSYSYPVVSILLAGDEHPTHGIRFLETYTPTIGDTVLIMATGQDEWVIGALAGSEKSNIGRVRSPLALLGHVGSTISESMTLSSSTFSVIGGTGTGNPLSIKTPYYPNRIYRAEATVRFKVTGAAPFYAGSTASIPSTSISATATVTNRGSITASVPSTAVSAATDSSWAGVMLWGRIRSGDASSSAGITYAGTSYPSSYIIENLTGDLSGFNALLALSGTLVVAGYGVHYQTTLAHQNLIVSGFTVNSGGTTPALPFVIMNHPFSLQGYNPSGTVYQGNEYPVSSTDGSPSANGAVMPTGEGTSGIVYNQPFWFFNIGGVSATFPSTDANVTSPSPLVNVGVSGTAASGSVTIPSSSANSLVSIGIVAPGAWSAGNTSPEPVYQEMEVINVTGGTGNYFTAHCSTTFWDQPNASVKTGTWQPTYTWNLAVKSVGSVAPTIEFESSDSQYFVVYDAGVNE